MTTLDPTPTQVRDALTAHGVPLRLYPGWDTVGRSWAGPDGSAGLMGVVVHHTSTASAVGVGPTWPSLEWCATAYSRPAANWLIGRDGTSWLLSAGSCYHCGNGGPWPAIGITEAGMHGHYRLVGIEIDDPGVSDTITAAQVDAVGRICATYRDLCGWGRDRIITHADWVDLGPYAGRKNDPLREFYPTESWRAASDLYVGGAPIPTSEEDDMAVLIHGRTPYLLSGGRLCRIGDVTKGKLAAAGVPVVGVDSADWPRLMDAYGTASMRGDA